MTPLDDISANVPKGIVVINCYASWCKACGEISPKYVSMSNSRSNKRVKFYKLEVEDCYDLAVKYDVEAVPTFLFFKNGELLKKNTITGRDTKKVQNVLSLLKQ